MDVQTFAVESIANVRNQREAVTPAVFSSDTCLLVSCIKAGEWKEALVRSVLAHVRTCAQTNTYTHIPIDYL